MSSRIWRRQPGVPLRVNLGHPLAKGIIEYGYVLGSGVPYSAIAGLVPSRVGAVTTVQTAQHGTAIEVVGTGNYINLGRNLSPASHVSFGFVRTRINSLAGKIPILHTSNDANGNYYGIFVDVKTDGGMAAAWGNGGGVWPNNMRGAETGAGAVAAGQEAHLSWACRAATDWSLNVNGVIRTPSNFGASGSMASGSANASINYRANTGSVLYGNQAVSAWAMFDGVANDALLQELYANPYAILEPIRRRIWVSLPTPTKLYFHDAANSQSGTFPTTKQSTRSFTNGANATGALTLRTMNPTIGTAMKSLQVGTVAVTAFRSDFMGYFCSPPLAGAQTVGGGNFAFNAAERESETAADFWINSPTVYVWRPSTGAVVGFIKDGAASYGGAEPTAATSTQVTNIPSITSNAVSAADGDVVIVEVYSYHAQQSTNPYTCTFYYDGTTENTTENAVVSNHASYIEFAETLTFQAAGGGKAFPFQRMGASFQHMLVR